MRDLLIHNKSFLMLWFSMLTTRFGNALTITVLMYHIGTQSHSPMMISMILFAQMTPMVLIGLFAGSIADRLPKFAVMIGSESFQLLTVTTMIFFLNRPSLLIFLIFLQGLGAAFYGPAKTAYLPYLVKEQNLPEAIGLSQGTTQATDMIGPPVAGVLLLIIKSGQILMIDVFTFLISAVLILVSYLFIRRKSVISETKAKEPLWISIIQGLKEVSALPALKFLIVIVFVLMLSAGVFNATSVAIELQLFHVTGFQYGLLESVSGIGAIAGPYLIKKIHPGKFIIWAGVLLGVWMALILFVQIFYIQSGLLSLFVWIAGLGILNSCLNIPVSSLFIVITPEKFRGRAVGTLQMFSFLGCIIGLIAGGAFAGWIGLIHMTVIAGLLMAAVSAGLTGTKGYKNLTAVRNRQNSKL